jgi:serine protease Do
MDLIQTDCAINSGNSGGALFNLYGEVIGITNAKYSSSGSEASIDNIGFAIPMNNVKDLITGLIENGYISKAYIGVSVEDVDEKNQQYGLPAGAAVAAVTENGPAAKAGVKAKDIITKVNGQEIKSSTELKRIVSASKGGDKLNLTIYRQGQTLEITVTVEEQKQSAAAQQEQQEQEGSTFNPFENFDPFEHFFG